MNIDFGEVEEFDYIKLYLPTHWKLTAEMQEWLETNVGPGVKGHLQFFITPASTWCSASSGQMWFKDEKKAMLFKLMWV